MHSPRLKDGSTLLAGIGAVLFNRLALRAGLRRRRDGWRRAAGLVLRGEAATFVLSAFGLDVWSGVGKPAMPDGEAARAHVARRLAAFLAGETDVHVCVERGASEDRAAPCGGPSYTLGFAPPVEGPARFVRPEDWSGVDESPRATDRTADPLLHFVCRLGPDGSADLWVRVNHVGADGVPVQEMLTRLESAWGASSRTLYPAPEAFEACRHPRRCAGRAGLAEVQAFVDFAPLLAWRKEQNARLPEPLTVSAAMLWVLGRHAGFAGIHMGTTVEVPAIDGLGRGVGVIVVRPADYFQRRGGLGRYARDFNREMELTRRRASGRCRTLDAAALVPAPLATALLRRGLEQGAGAFGSLGLTILRDARVFGAPIGDAGHHDGFIAIGSMALPTERGGRVGCMTVKGPAARIAEYPRMLREAIERCADVRSDPREP